MDKNRAFVPLFSMHARKTLPPLTVSLLALPETTPTILYSLYEVFLSVGVTWSELTGERNDVRRMAPWIVAATKEPFISAIGLPVTPQATLDEVDVSDLVVVTDLVFSPGQSPRGRWSLETAWVRDQFRNGAMVTSVCTGSLFLAESGLLDGEPATTHWSAAETFRACYPEVDLAAERTLCPAGREHRLVTSGGAAAWEDLALYLIARFCGEAEALHIAKIFVLGDRSEGQLSYAAMARPRKHSDAVIADSQVWIAQNYAESHPVSRMIERSGLAQRTFKRRFQAATGYTPVDYVQALRIEEAKQLLETGDLSTEEVAHAVGYEDPVYFRRLFKRRTCTTPARYRKRFQWLIRGNSQN